MSTDVEKQIITEFLDSGAAGDAEAPQREGLTVGDLAGSLPHSASEIRNQLEISTAVAACPVERNGAHRYRLSSIAAGRHYRDELCDLPPEAWPGCSIE